MMIPNKMYYVVYIRDNDRYIYGVYRDFDLALRKKQECDEQKQVKSHIEVKGGE